MKSGFAEVKSSRANRPSKVALPQRAKVPAVSSTLPLCRISLSVGFQMNAASSSPRFHAPAIPAGSRSFRVTS